MRVTPIRNYRYNNIQPQQLGTQDKTNKSQSQMTEMPSYAYRPAFGATDSSKNHEEEIFSDSIVQKAITKELLVKSLQKQMNEAKTPEFWDNDQNVILAGKHLYDLAVLNPKKLVELSKSVTKDGTPFVYEVFDRYRWEYLHYALNEYNNDEYAEIYFSPGCFKGCTNMSLFQYQASYKELLANDPNVRKINHFQNYGIPRLLSDTQLEQEALYNLENFLRSISRDPDWIAVAQCQASELKYSESRERTLNMIDAAVANRKLAGGFESSKGSKEKKVTSFASIIKDDTPEVEDTSIPKASTLKLMMLNKLSQLNKDNRPKFYDMPYDGRVELLRDLVNKGLAPDEVVKFLKSKPGNSKISIGYEGTFRGPWVQDINDIFKNYPKHLADIYFSTDVYDSQGVNKDLSLFIFLGRFEENAIAKHKEWNGEDYQKTMYSWGVTKAINDQDKALKDFLRIISKDPELMNIARNQANTLATEQTKNKLLNMIEEVETEETRAKTRKFVDDTMKKFNSDKNYILEFANIIQTDENKDGYNEVINVLKRYQRNIDFNLRDDFGITVAEKVLNSENEQLLDLMKSSKNLNYSPELDWAYNNIQNEEFKKKVNELKLNFPDIKRVIKTSSKEGLKRVENQFKSPFYDVNRQGEEFAQLAENSTPEFTAYFYARFGDYLPEYTQKMIVYYNSLARNK